MRRLDAPAVLFGVLEGALHFLLQDLEERGSADGLGAGFADIARAIARSEHAAHRLFDPIRLQPKTKGVAEHQSRADDRSDWIGHVFPGQRWRRAMDWLEKRCA